ncbi:RNA polymerase recycling motor HelD [Peribacillus kribbensis]|uniref:RNA polymerase recycling motor HelD n=1 Tax=Peribacillus kribbensis TaxID=356658 RepID=UPI0004135E8F|nr:RNA polymerase recycling motor HelD [Peribacillus kribbensis]
MSDTHLDWNSEQERIDLIKKEINRQQHVLRGKSGSLKQGIIGLRETFWEDVTVNLDEPDDIIETQASLKQQAELLSERERSHGVIHETLKKLARLENTPYFGRIDFKEEIEPQTDEIYIGIASLLDEAEENFLIYDWRAPISSMYYDYPPGPASYETMDGRIEGELELKRQFIIRHGKLKGLFDTGLTIGDRLLQEMLGSQANTKMKSIVATIQKEQNQIIRNEKSKILVVQGVAGSGKTSAALQRVAYLLYSHRETLDSKNMILFSPNPLFNSYISTVLPELGEENMRQTTYKEFMESLVGREFDVEDPFMQMEMSLSGQSPERMSTIPYKTSLEFKHLITKYTDHLAQEGLIFRSISFRGKTLIPANRIHSFFYTLENHISIPNRIRLTAEWILKEIALLEKEEREEEWVLEEIQLLDKEDYQEVHQELQKRNRRLNETFGGSDQEEALLRKKLVSRYFKPIRNRVKKFRFIDLPAVYSKLFKEQHSFLSGELPEEWKAVCEYSLKSMADRTLLWEDVTPYLYFRDQLIGRKSFSEIRHIFIDEFQDYTSFQFDYLKELFKMSSMTLLGDFNQAIYPHSSKSSTLLEEKTEESVERITLNRSYRSTRQIVEFTRELIDGRESIIPFNREGSRPEIISCSKDDLSDRLEKGIEESQAQGYETIAVICKTAGECDDVYQALKDSVDIQIMDQGTTSYSKGIVVLPAYLAKGIEFDSVIIHDASEESYHSDSELKLFYTACTRAMHRLMLFSPGEVSPFIQKVPEDRYSFKKM